MKNKNEYIFHVSEDNRLYKIYRVKNGKLTTILDRTTNMDAYICTMQSIKAKSLKRALREFGKSPITWEDTTAYKEEIRKEKK